MYNSKFFLVRRNAIERYRMLMCLVLCFFLITVGVIPCFAGEAETVRVAVINYPNYIQMNDDGTVSGYAYEYLQDIRKYTGWRYEFVEMSFTQATNALEKGDIDILAGNQYTAARAESYDFSARDMGEGGSVLCVMPDDMRYCYNDYASYNGMRIAALTSSVRVEQTRKKLAQYGVSAEFITFDTDEESKEALENGEVDAVLMSITRCESKYKILARLSTAPLYFGINKHRPELKASLDAAVEEIHLEAPYYEEKLNEKYYGSIPVQLSFTQEEKEYIAKSGSITVAVANDLMPVEYYSREFSGYCGVVPDSFSLIEKYSGLTFNFVPRQNMELLKGQMSSGRIQLIASVADKESLADLWGVDLSDSYFDNSVSIVISDSVSNYKDTDGSLVLRTGYPYLEQLAGELGYTNLLFADTFKDCVAMVNSKKADLTLIPSDCVDSIIHRNSYGNVSSYLVPDSNTDFCIGVARGTDPLLLSILNKSISSITKEQRAELLVQNLTIVNGTPTFQSFFSSHRASILMLAFICAALIIAGLICFAITRQRLNHQLKSALEKADVANRTKTEFLARMSHDMRTPMNGILGLSYLMEESRDASELQKEILQLRESGEYLLQLINDMLDVNKAEIGQIELHPTACDEEQLFSSIISLIQPQMEKKNIDFHFEKKNIQWTYMMLDEQRVKQIFINLLSNAVKFTPEGGRIDFIMELVSENEYMIRDRFIIRDSGIGMTEEFMPSLFKPFSQENRMPGENNGTGLGLVIVKSLVELMGGSISVKSKVNEGTEFTLYLNFPIASQPDNEEASGQIHQVSFPGHIRILLCEDHPVNAEIAMRLLKKWGADVVWKENGQLGVEAFSQSEPGDFDVILMDIRMPVMDGLEAARTIRKLKHLDAKTIPIIAITANAYDEDIIKSFEAGMNEHLAKPVVPTVMYEAILKQIAARRSNARKQDQKSKECT